MKIYIRITNDSDTTYVDEDLRLIVSDSLDTDSIYLQISDRTRVIGVSRDELIRAITALK